MTAPRSKAIGTTLLMPFASHRTLEQIAKGQRFQRSKADRGASPSPCRPAKPKLARACRRDSEKAFADAMARCGGRFR